MQPDINQNTNDDKTTLAGFARPASLVCAILGVVVLAVAVGIGFSGGDEGLRHLAHSYLTSYAFYLSITLGALFFVILQHVTRAGWSVTVRRLAELMAANTPVLAVLFVPIAAAVFLAGVELYPWADSAKVSGNHLLEHKSVYLNPAFFMVRAVLYFAVWAYLGRFFLSRSLEQDNSSDPALTEQMERFSPVAMILFAVTLTFASFDWLMSLEPTWFSTIYGVYYFSGAVVGSLAMLILVTIMLQAAGRLKTSVTVEHYHDLGKLLFAFVVFWGYIAFSQYMLIWYANIPEETEWYLVRQTGAWHWVTVGLLFGHLLIPFFGMISREVKRRRMLLGFWAAWMLVWHWIDMYWLVMPSFDGTQPTFGLIDVCCLVGLDAIWGAGLLRLAANRPLVAAGDPRFEESLAFENV